MPNRAHTIAWKPGGGKKPSIGGENDGAERFGSKVREVLGTMREARHQTSLIKIHRTPPNESLSQTPENTDGCGEVF